MKWFVTGILLSLLSSLPALAGDDCGCSRHHSKAGARAECCCDKAESCSCKPELCPCLDVEVERTECLEVPFTDEGCWIIDPQCCPRSEYRLVCPARRQFELLCEPKCKKHHRRSKCRQDTCTTCGDRDDWSIDE